MKVSLCCFFFLDVIASYARFEDKLQITHLPEMVFGERVSCLLNIAQTGIRLHFNALDALKAWKQEALPPVEVPAAAKWKFRSKPSDQVILDYDYTFTTPYCGSDVVMLNPDTLSLHFLASFVLNSYLSFAKRFVSHGLECILPILGVDAAALISKFESQNMGKFNDIGRFLLSTANSPNLKDLDHFIV
ncbi:hypothetical protein ABZP36_000546 [Zizania latifolia]